jgi:hypothetical protein
MYRYCNYNHDLFYAYTRNYFLYYKHLFPILQKKSHIIIDFDKYRKDFNQTTTDLVDFLEIDYKETLLEPTVFGKKSKNNIPKIPFLFDMHTENINEVTAFIFRDFNFYRDEILNFSNINNISDFKDSYVGIFISLRSYFSDSQFMYKRYWHQWRNACIDKPFYKKCIYLVTTDPLIIFQVIKDIKKVFYYGSYKKNIKKAIESLQCLKF